MWQRGVVRDTEVIVVAHHVAVVHRAAVELVVHVDVDALATTSWPREVLSPLLAAQQRWSWRRRC